MALPIETTTDKKAYRHRRRFGRVTSRRWPSGRRTFRALWFYAAAVSERRRATVLAMEFGETTPRG